MRRLVPILGAAVLVTGGSVKPPAIAPSATTPATNPPAASAQWEGWGGETPYQPTQQEWLILECNQIQQIFHEHQQGWGLTYRYGGPHTVDIFVIYSDESNMNVVMAHVEKAKEVARSVAAKHGWKWLNVTDTYVYQP